jgi:hypothetical protein
MNNLTEEERQAFQEIKSGITTKLMIMMSVVSEFLGIERLGLWRDEAASFDEFAGQWGFSKQLLDEVSESLEVLADVRGIVDPGILTKLEMTDPFINLETPERRRLARQLVKQDGQITPQLILDRKLRLFPEKCI